MKKNTRKIEHQLNIGIFIKDYGNLIENKPK